jgi:hypothetical protein
MEAVSVMEEWITHREAAEHLGVTTLHISTLVRQGRLQRGTGKQKYLVSKQDTMNYVRQKPGRKPKGDVTKYPSYTVTKRLGWKRKDHVRWIYYPVDGFGYRVMIPARIKQIGPFRVRIEFKDKTGVTQSRWVRPERLRRDKPLGEIFLLHLNRGVPMDAESHVNDAYRLCSKSQYLSYLESISEKDFPIVEYVNGQMYTIGNIEDFWKKTRVVPMSDRKLEAWKKLLGAVVIGKWPQVGNPQLLID